MSTKAIAAIGTLIKMGDGQISEAFTTIAEVGDIDGPKLSADEIDVTSHDTTGSFNETIPGTLDAGTLDFPMNYIVSDTIQQELETHYLARDRFNVQMITPLDPDNTPEADRTSQFVVFVKNYSRQAPVKGALKRSVSLRIVGAPTLGMGS